MQNSTCCARGIGRQPVRSNAADDTMRNTALREDILSRKTNRSPLRARNPDLRDGDGNTLDVCAVPGAQAEPLPIVATGHATALALSLPMARAAVAAVRWTMIEVTPSPPKHQRRPPIDHPGRSTSSCARCGPRPRDRSPADMPPRPGSGPIGRARVPQLENELSVEPVTRALGERCARTPPRWGVVHRIDARRLWEDSTARGSRDGSGSLARHRRDVSADAGGAPGRVDVATRWRW